jgi:hypothetical protein
VQEVGVESKCQRTFEPRGGMVCIGSYNHNIQPDTTHNRSPQPAATTIKNLHRPPNSSPPQTFHEMSTETAEPSTVATPPNTLEMEETIARIRSHKGIEAVIIMDGRGMICVFFNHYIHSA